MWVNNYKIHILQNLKNSGCGWNCYSSLQQYTMLRQPHHFYKFYISLVSPSWMCIGLQVFNFPMWYRADNLSIQEIRADNSIYRTFRTIKSSKIFVKQDKHKSFSAVHLNFSNVYSILGHYKMLIANSFNPNFAHWHKTMWTQYLNLTIQKLLSHN